MNMRPVVEAMATMMVMSIGAAMTSPVMLQTKIRVVTVPGGSNWKCSKCNRELASGEKVGKIGSKVYCKMCLRMYPPKKLYMTELALQEQEFFNTEEGQEMLYVVWRASEDIIGLANNAQEALEKVEGRWIQYPQLKEWHEGFQECLDGVFGSGGDAEFLIKPETFKKHEEGFFEREVRQ